MNIIDEINDEFKVTFYGKKAEKYGLSNEVLVGSIAQDSIHIMSLLSKSTSKNVFLENIKEELLKDTNTDYLHFTLIFGLYFGVFNLYNYFYVCPPIRKEVLKQDICPQNTVKFLDIYQSLLFSYLKEEYGLDSNSCKDLIKELFLLRQDNKFLYSSNVIRDIGMILMGNSMSSKMLNCKEAIELYEEKTKEYLKTRSL